jgi:hypothetical protein
VLALGANAGDAQECAKLGKVLVVMIFDEFSKFHKRMPPELCMIAKRGEGCCLQV